MSEIAGKVAGDTRRAVPEHSSTEYGNYSMRTWILVCLSVLALAGCGESVGGGDGKVNSPDDRAQQEFRICQQQADQIARQQGTEAASAHLDECVSNYANGTQ